MLTAIIVISCEEFNGLGKGDLLRSKGDISAVYMAQSEGRYPEPLSSAKSEAVRVRSSHIQPMARRTVMGPIGIPNSGHQTQARQSRTALHNTRTLTLQQNRRDLP